MGYVLKKIFHLPRTLVIFLIGVYQKIFSPDHSFWAKKAYPHGYCRFYPTCSEYTKQAIKRRGVFVGALKGLWRVLRCNPWNKGGIDLPN